MEFSHLSERNADEGSSRTGHMAEKTMRYGSTRGVTAADYPVVDLDPVIHSTGQTSLCAEVVWNE